VVLSFWKDSLQKAGIQDDSKAFSTYANLVDTLQKLQESGVTYPLALTTTARPIILHEAAIWLWHAGGDFISPDYRRVIFNEPAGL
jgi:multiple sugar transport system substrate-binding protein